LFLTIVYFGRSISVLHLHLCVIAVLSVSRRPRFVWFQANHRWNSRVWVIAELRNWSYVVHIVDVSHQFRWCKMSTPMSCTDWSDSVLYVGM